MELNYFEKFFSIKHQIKCPDDNNTSSVPASEERKASAVLEYYMLDRRRNLLDAFESGIGAVIPASLLRLFTPKEFENLVCGSTQVDLGLLKRLTIYDDGLDENTPHIMFFWDALESMGNEEREQFINFVYAKRRLPSSAAGFMMPFHITKPTSAMKANPDKFLPHAQTCFFELSIPKYSSVQICRQKLLYAVENCTTMEDYSSGSTDFVI